MLRIASATVACGGWEIARPKGESRFERNHCLNAQNTFSIGLYSGLYGGRNSTRTLLASAIECIILLLWMPQLSITATHRAFRYDWIWGSCITKTRTWGERPSAKGLSKGHCAIIMILMTSILATHRGWCQPNRQAGTSLHSMATWRVCVHFTPPQRRSLCIPQYWRLL